MKFRIHFMVGGYEDSFVICGDSFEEIRRKADEELARLGGRDP